MHFNSRDETINNLLQFINICVPFATQDLKYKQYIDLAIDQVSKLISIDAEHYIN